MRATVTSSITLGLTITVPPLATPSTYETYGLGTATPWEDTWFGDNASALQYIADQLPSTTYTSNNPQCFVGIDLGPTLLGWLRKV